MKNYKLLIAYDGGKYKGWQKLGGEDADKTVQGKIEAVLTKCFERPMELIGASRTDAGVHSKEQVANFKVKSKASAQDIVAYMRAYLPEDIAIKHIQEVEPEFHARFHAKGKTYLYQIWQTEVQDPFQRKYLWHVRQKLNVDAMNEAAQAFLGTHDFTTFTNAKSKKKSMERTIEKIDIQKEGHMLTIRITGDGFLHNMVRKMVGMLVEVGQGELSPADVVKSLEAKDRSHNSPLAPAQGLFLEKVHY